MKKYSRLTLRERYLIECGIRERRSNQKIADSIGRPKKTIISEINKSGGRLRYDAVRAHEMGRQSNKKGYSKIKGNPELELYIRDKLDQGWSPEVIAGRWNHEKESRVTAASPAVEAKKISISKEAIYQWIYQQEGDLYKKLARKKKKRGLKPQRNRSKIPNRVAIQDRPESINNRSEIGHYEADLIFQKGNRSRNILSIIERKSRMIILKKNESKHSDVVIGSLKDAKLNNKYPMLSVTFDNGTEFANHAEMEVSTYFCEPGSPWEKGGVENANGIVRRHLDYRIDLNLVSQKMLDQIADTMNNTPRKILNFLTANEFMQNVYKEKLEGVTF